jgi:hypothetical protein
MLKRESQFIVSSGISITLSSSEDGKGDFPPELEFMVPVN